MKKIFLLASLALGLCAAVQTDAQVRINVNIGNPMPVYQQSWYGSDCDYYYMPDQGVYYNVNRRMYVWPGRGGWVCGPALPASYGACTWGNSRYYAFRDRSPFMRNDFYRQRYAMRGNYGRGGYAYRNDGRFDGRRDGRWNDDRRGGGWNEGRRGGGRWDDNRGRGDDRRWENDRGGDRNYGNNNGGGERNYGNNGGGRAGWDRR